MLVTDSTQATRPLPDLVKKAFDRGCDAVLLREPTLVDSAREELAVTIKKICADYHNLFFISHDLLLAKKLGVDGVHLKAVQSCQDARDFFGAHTITIGQSCHSMQEALQAERNGADYISLSPIFISASKPDYGPALGLAMLKRIAKKIALPVLALGGITPDNTALCHRAGAHGVMMMGSFMRDAR